MHKAMPVPEMMPVPEVMTVHEVRPSAEVSAAEMAPTAAEASSKSTTAAISDFDGQVIGQIFSLCRSGRIDQRNRLRALGRRSEQHQPRHGEEAKQSHHQWYPSLDPKADANGLYRFCPTAKARDDEVNAA